MTLRKGKPWGDSSQPVKLKEVKTVEQDEVSVSIDVEAVAKALANFLKREHPDEKVSVRSKADEKLIFCLTLSVAILSVACIICALISAITASSYSRTIEKLLR